MDQFPGNSNRSRATPTETVETEKNISPVVSGEVVRRKQPISKRIKDAFIGGDGQSVKDHILLGVVIPAIKNMVVDAAQDGVERLVMGEDYRPSRRMGRGYGGGPSGNFNYAGISKGPIAEPRGRANDHALSRHARMMHNFDEVVLPERVDAEMVLTQMFDLLDRFEVVTVADFYALVGQTSSFTDRKYGWTDLRGTRPARVRGGGWVLDLPPTESLD